MENNSQNKQRFFANYWGQNILLPDELLIDMPTTVENISSLCEDERLLLKPLSAISDEDRAYIAKLIPTKHNDGTYDLEPFQHTADYLRSKGYFIPFMDLSIEQILEYKWAVIK